MDASLLSIAVLALLFLGAFIPRFSLALAALPAAVLVASVAGVSVEELLGFFPADFFVLIVGITALFTVAQTTGVTDWLLARALRPIGDRIVLIPLLLFAVGALITAIGTLPAAAIAIMAPVTLGMAAKRRLPPLLLCLTMLNGVTSGLFSPIAVFGSTTPPLMAKAGIEVPAQTGLALLLASLGTGLVLCLIVMLVGRRSLRAAAATSGTHGSDQDQTFGASDGSGRPTGSRSTARAELAPDAASQPLAAGAVATEPSTAVLTQSATEQASHTAPAVPQPSSSGPTRRAIWSTSAALVVLVVGGAVFQLDLGFLGLTLALALQLLLQLKPAAIITRLPWEVVLLIAGLLTYVGLMEHLGAFERITNALNVVGSPTLTLLAVCLIVGITSFFASSLAVIATGVPLVAPLVAAGVSPIGAVIAVALSAVLVDANPLGITGGLLLGSAAPEHRERLFRHLMIYGLCAIVLGPLVAWAAFGSW